MIIIAGRNYWGHMIGHKSQPTLLADCMRQAKLARSQLLISQHQQIQLNLIRQMERRDASAQPLILIMIQSPALV